MPEDQRSILFVSDIPPRDAMASSVVLYRHLKRLELEGYRIYVLLPAQAMSGATLERSWNYKLLPPRKAWYPPYRPYSLWQRLRYQLMWQDSKAFIAESKANVVLSLLHGVFFSGFAAYISRKMRVPLGFFYHDATELLEYAGRPEQQRIAAAHIKAAIAEASIVWSVSSRLKYFTAEPAGKFSVLPPVPEEFSGVQPSWRKELTVAYAGALYNEVLVTMLAIGKRLQLLQGKLLIITQLSENAQKLRLALGATVEIVDPFPTTPEVCAYVASRATGFIVAYPLRPEDMPWAVSCFPSKFVQFTQTGLPLLVLAPAETAIADWCRQRSWLAYGSDYSDAGIDRLLALLTKQEDWQQCSAQTYEAAREFAPERIHTKVLADIRRVTGN